MTQQTDLERAVEHDLMTRYRKGIWGRFIGAMQDYRMIDAGDRIAVCVSGGKDSLLLAVCLRALQKHSTVPYTLTYLTMNPGYTQEDSEKIARNAARLNLTTETFDADIFPALQNVKRSCCHVCAAMRRGYLYKEAQKRGCNKIALGHHFDDAVETLLLSQFYGGEYKAMLPKLHSDHYAGMSLIRPLYYVRQRDIEQWRDDYHLSCLQCACEMTRREDSGKRARVKALLETLERETPTLPYNLFHSAESVNLRAVLGHRDGQNADTVSFLTYYDQEESLS